MHQGMSDKDPKGFIRFEKCMSLARLVSQILGYKDRAVSVETHNRLSREFLLAREKTFK